MLGQLERGRERLFYEFSLEAIVPVDHMIRRVASVLDLSWLRGELASHYSHTGRSSIDPELMVRLLLIGYVSAIRSERQLCAEVQVNLAIAGFAVWVLKIAFRVIRCFSARPSMSETISPTIS